MKTENDKKAIENSYLQALQNLYRVLLEGYATAGNEDERARAHERFQTGLEMARDVRRVALELL